MNKEDLLAKIRANIHTTYDMPSFDDMKGVQYADPLKQFVEMSKTVGGKVVELENGQDINEVIKTCYPDAKVIASNLPEVTIANRNPDTVAEANDLNGTDVGVVRGVFGVAENGCIWIPQTMKQKAVCFISEYLVILLDRKQIVNNMHEAYQRIEFNSYGYGCFISGPSKTADIAQALVMGAQAARGVTVVLE
ncbi:MAG: LUD domain-containing protein [Prevotellaceae bacterium]|nr:LUD domain-containing protein [Prevotellaceae bacterium]